MLLLTLRGTPTLYYGDEIGMQQVAIVPEQVRDPFEKNVPGIGVGRDGCRTPMQWDATTYAGLFDIRPWLPLAEDAAHENVVNLDADAASILSLYKALIGLRKKLPQLVSGDYMPIAAEGDLLLYRARSRGEGSDDCAQSRSGARFDHVERAGLSSEILLSTFLDRRGRKDRGRAGSARQ